MQIFPLNLGTIHVVDSGWPVHGFAVLHPTLGAVLIDTGCGGPDELFREFRVVNRAVADAMADHGLHPSDVRMVINTHLHFDHCGQNAAFPQARLFVQRSEHERVRSEEGNVSEWLDASGVEFELLDGDTSFADDLRALVTPGHTVGHQSVLADTDDGLAVFVGDAAFRRTVWESPDGQPLAPGQAADVSSWRRSLDALRSRSPARVYFCHDD